MSQIEVISSPKTPIDTKEKATEKCMNEDSSSNVEIMVTSSSKSQNTKGRQRTRPKNKLRMNVKSILDSKFKKDMVTTIEYSSSEEDPKIMNMEQTVAQTLENIEKNLKIFPEILEGNHKNKGKQKVQNFEIGMSSKLINMESQT